MGVRDDFPKSVLETLAKRVGYRCSKPGCRKLTSGPHSDEAKAVNIGVGGHITAASPGGPRNDPSLTPEQRRSADNGIWLCQTCGKLVDNDEVKFPAPLLREWRRKAEEAARSEVESSRPPRPAGSCLVATHLGDHEAVDLSDCERHGTPVVPAWLGTTPERRGSDWLVDRFSRDADLRLYFDPKWAGGTWFVADVGAWDGVVINPEQLRELKSPSPTTTTTPEPPSRTG